VIKKPFHPMFRNPVVAELRELLSQNEVHMFDVLEAAWHILDEGAYELYERGADAQATELAVIAEDIAVRIEEMAEEVLGEREEPEGSEFERSGREIEQTSIEDDLVSAYAAWLRFENGHPPYPFAFDSREDFVDTLRRIAHHHPSHHQPLDPSVTDEQLIEAARDAYEDRVRKLRAFGY
jgi:hypothetical protein